MDDRLPPGFHDLAAMPDPGPPLVPRELPKRAGAGGALCIIERVPIEGLLEWKQDHGVEFARAADLGREIGPVALYWPKGE